MTERTNRQKAIDSIISDICVLARPETDFNQAVLPLTKIGYARIDNNHVEFYEVGVKVDKETKILRIDPTNPADDDWFIESKTHEVNYHGRRAKIQIPTKYKFSTRM